MNRNINIPNILSAYRLLAAPFLVYFLYRNMEMTFASFLFLSLFSDVADGYIARKDKKVTRLGASLDSIGDAVTFIIAAYGVWHFHSSFVIEHKTLIIASFAPYLLQILIATIKYGKPSSFHTYLAKSAAGAQGVFMLVLFFFQPIMWLFYLAMIVTILEVIEEIILVLILPEWKADVKGLYWVLKE